MCYQLRAARLEYISALTRAAAIYVRGHARSRRCRLGGRQKANPTQGLHAGLRRAVWIILSR